MATETTIRRYRMWYAALLRLYPRRFQERFGEGMAQTFHDLCRERGEAQQGLAGFVLWIFFETLRGVIREGASHMTQMSRTVLRAALVALGLLMAPLGASRVVHGWNWPPRAFVLAYVLFFGTALAYALIARRMGSWAYKAGVGSALAAGFVLGWASMVHTSESENPLNLVYFAVLAVGGVGAWMARLEARGMARALLAMAAVLAVVALIAVLSWDAPVGPAPNQVFLRGVCAAVFVASGLLFRRASLAGTK